jgi:hypothetical protein
MKVHVTSNGDFHCHVNKWTLESMCNISLLIGYTLKSVLW